MDTESLRRPLGESFNVDDINKEIIAAYGKPNRLPLLETREQTHGSFEENAKISQGIKEWFRSSPGWVGLNDIEREAMDMIALKFSRILSGKSMVEQHWEDVVGYARLVEEKCK